MTLREKAKQGIITLIRKNHQSSRSHTNALMLPATTQIGELRKSSGKESRGKRPQQISKDFTVSVPALDWGETEQDKANASTGFFTHITVSIECVVSIFHLTGSLTSTEQQTHLTKSHEKVSPASYRISILSI